IYPSEIEAFLCRIFVLVSKTFMLERLAGNEYYCFLDGFSGYFQIPIDPKDQEKTTFTCPYGTFAYKHMPFGLCNAPGTFQRCMMATFHDMIEKRWRCEDTKLALNWEKIHFMMKEGIVLGHKISKKGIEVDKAKIEVISKLPHPMTVKASRSLLGHDYSPKIEDFLCRILSWFFKTFTLKKYIKKSEFRWTAKAEQAFQQLKQHLSELPLLVAPNPQEELIMYLSATYGAVSAVLMTKRGTTQTPIYFKSQALQGPELNYSPIEKLVLSLVFATKRLRRHFQAHPITVITDQPIKQVMTRPDAAGRLQKWGIMLGEHNITYRPRTSVKGKILADFLVEMQGNVSQAAPAAVAQEEPWTLFTDGSSCVDGSGAGLILTNPEGVEFTYALSQVPQSKNKQADALSKIASTSFAHLSKQVLVEVLEDKSIKEKAVAAAIEEDGPTWMTQLVHYLKEGVLPGDNMEARKLCLKARQYELREGVLYRRSFLTPWLRCVGPLQADYVMREIHEGSCSMHAGSRSVVAKAIRLSMPLSGGAEEGQVPDSHNGLLHEVGRSQGGGNDYRRAERANRSLGEGIKARLGEGNKNWVEELPHVLWAHQTTIKSSHGDTPFSQTYGTEAVIPAEIGMPTYRTTAVDVVNNDKELRLNLDLLKERRERAGICEARAKSKMMKYYNARVRGVAFKPGIALRTQSP
nr:hypothetical protein [Tanacetum cinerariifolium]